MTLHSASMRRAYTQGLNKSGYLLKRQTVRLLTTGSRSGRIYVIRGKRHQASAAGEPPAKLSGRLAASVGFDVRSQRLTVGESAPYAGYLEKGTSKMEARPHLLITFNNNANAVERIIAREIHKELT